MDVEVQAMVLNVVIPDDLRWTGVRRGEEVWTQQWPGGKPPGHR